MEYTLTKPIVYEDKEIAVLNLDLEGLTGNDVLIAVKEARTLGENDSFIDTSKTYLAAIAARAAKVKINQILALSAKDFSKLTIEVQNFLLL